MLNSHDHQHLLLFPKEFKGFRRSGRERRGGGEEVESAETAS